jgi:hypothetical protein
MIKKICKQCNKEFKTKRNIRIFCSLNCFHKYSKENGIFPIDKTGTIQSKKTKEKISIGIKNNYIKNPEKRIRQKNIALKNGTGKWMKNKKLSLNTRKKMSDNRKGKKHWNWKGGINPINDTIRKSFELKLWKKSCMERDNFTCQKTGQKGGELVVHHINNFSNFPELRTSISNGITLSKESHSEFHKIYGFKNNTLEQILEYINKLSIN